MNMRQKKERQRLIKQILEEKEIGEQFQLLEELRKRGIKTTQATISRDLQEMGVVKVRIKPGVYKYELMQKGLSNRIWEKIKVAFENFVESIDYTGNLILIKTSPGNAHGVAALIDELKYDGILGTLAGDDSILVIVKQPEKTKKIVKELSGLLPR